MTEAEAFLKYNYPETKDMCLHFLTLITAVLVFSLNFSEKVFDFHNSTSRKRLVAISSWCLYILSIIFCGLGLVTNSLAGGHAVAELDIEGAYQQQTYYSLAQVSYAFIISSGFLFILGLFLTMFAAIISRRIKDKSEAHGTTTSV